MQTAYEGMSPKAQELIQQMLDSGDSQQLAVGDCLNTIAENGDDQNTDEHLICCAEEIRDAANYFVQHLATKKTYTAFCQEASGEGTIWISSIEATDLEDAKKVAKEMCLNDWNDDSDIYDTDDIHVLGIAEGDVEIKHWEDICDT